jgi:ceramide glucosyltransferase
MENPTDFTSIATTIIEEESISVLDWLVPGLSIGCILFASGLLLIQFIAVCFARYHFHQKKNQKLTTKAPGVSILKPLRFTDQEVKYLSDNLESFFTLVYSKYEIIFCVRDYDDSAVPIVEKLIRKYPNIPCKLLIGGNDIGINPKINNMQKGYEQAKYEFIWICDAGIRAHPDTLNDMMLRMLESKSVALVHQLPYVDSIQKNVGSYMEKIYFGTQHGRIQIFAHCINQVCITGMSNLIRRQALDEACGGLIGLSSYIAEDYFMTIKMHEAGWTFRMSTYPALQNLINPTIRTFFRRMVRWSRLRIKMLPGVTIVEPFSECFLSGLLFSLGVGHFTDFISTPAIFSLYTTWWLTMDIILVYGLQSSGSRIPLLKFIPLWILRESSTIPILLTALLRPDVKWIGSAQYKIGFGGKAEKIKTCQNDDLQ